ncbi:hypothetical protein A2Z22_02400 [Candidatus Woesebacteria bacterium RBG_16_34_12]|uniref:alanine--tRNA ligase n=1 Tax=Candidatus Woesebacteria bacterium RBG_16_34_12 TaxID=1802480 RepID=A0A1F7XBB3_9BACT|nr:MAG: hypothetical protein A2Z22_02400 [Candidatus Woesebacteria bacterium RBG_16_34_12]
MTANEVRKKYLDFFKNPPRNHREIAPSPLVLENDPTTLFTSSGMQPLVPYLMGEPHPSKSKRLVNSQPSIRLQDIEEVGDNRHTTFFEMLGNWSLGDYFKKEQLAWIYEFFTKELVIDKDRLWISVFEGTSDVSKDTESFEIWKSLGIPEEKIIFYGAKKNWWSMTGTPEEMNIGHIGGPDSEIFYDFDPNGELKIHEKSIDKARPCHPNCECGRFLEIGNSVFIQYKKVGENKLEELPQKNVDFGGGLERTTAAVNNTPDIFLIDIFENVIKDICEKASYEYSQDQGKDRSVRIIADHLRAAIMLIRDGVTPSNKQQGYVLRRLVRRAEYYRQNLFLTAGEIQFSSLVKGFIKSYPELKTEWRKISAILDEEYIRFDLALQNGKKKLLKAIENRNVNGRLAFDLYQTDGFPLELTLDILEKEGKIFSDKDRKEFETEFAKHKQLSRTASAGIFKGGLADHSEEVVRLHTATHLLLASLRKVLGEHVVQKGQNITKERARFDFPNPEKLTNEELQRVEETINDVIKKDLQVKFKVMPKEDALKTGAIHAFNEKYADTVKVYYVGNSPEDAFSKEFCGGPHVRNTSEIGRAKIKKQEKIGSGLVRIYLVIE